MYMYETNFIHFFVYIKYCRKRHLGHPNGLNTHFWGLTGE